jgi:sugar lactone lactonase YvrE
MKRKLKPLLNYILYSLFIFSLLTVLSSCNKLFHKKTEPRDVIVYPEPPEQPRFQFLTKITTSKDIGAVRNAFSKIVLGDEKHKTIVKPYGIAIHKGKIYVCDNYGGGMEILDLDKKKFDFFVTKGKGKLKIPINCFVDEKGYLYVADIGRYEIIVFDDKLNYVKSFGLPEKFKPSDVCVYGDKIFVANIASSKINVFSNDSVSKLLYSFPEENVTGSATLGLPVNLTINKDIVYAADFGYSMIKKYSIDGNLIDTIGSGGDNPGQFTKLKGIAVDDEDNIFAVDAAFENVQVFNKEGKLLIVLGGHYEGPGGLVIPAKVIIDYDNLRYFQQYVDPAYDLKYLVLVTSQYGPDRINVYGRIEPKQIKK